ncbi:MAG TPA: hypothetical protein PKA61_01865 [Nitrospira sp.]|nr:hypothetical protein [Nitrospira sp.]
MTSRRQTFQVGKTLARKGPGHFVRWIMTLLIATAGCATKHYTPLAEADIDQIEQLTENVFRVEYRVSAFTSQAALDRYFIRRCAELTLREGYDYFHVGRRFDVLMLSRRTSMTLTLYKGEKPADVPDFIDARTVLREPE